MREREIKTQNLSLFTLKLELHLTDDYTIISTSNFSITTLKVYPDSPFLSRGSMNHSPNTYDLITTNDPFTFEIPIG